MTRYVSRTLRSSCQPDRETMVLIALIHLSSLSSIQLETFLELTEPKSLANDLRYLLSPSGEGTSSSGSRMTTLLNSLMERPDILTGLTAKMEACNLVWMEELSSSPRSYKPIHPITDRSSIMIQERKSSLATRLRLTRLKDRSLIR